MANRGPCIQGCHKDKKPPAGAERAYATFMLLEKPFDGVQDLPDPCTYPKHLYGNLADPRAYPKHLDRDLPSTPIEDPKNAYFKVKEQGNPRPWPVPDKNGAPSKRKRDAHNYPFSPHHPSGHSMMYRWLDEPGRAGPYHATDSVVPTKRSSHVHNAIKKKV